jgi:hypothetical protein
MPSLIALAGWEEAILASLKGAAGSLEEKDEQIRRSGLYAEYPAVLRSYIDHFASEESAKEALKRAVFLVWTSALEAPPVSGIAEFPERYSREVMEAVEDAALHRGLDEEFLTMLAWYRSVSALPFELFGADRHIVSATRDTASDAWREQFRAAQFSDRGQLGHYWRSIVTAATS